MFTQAKRLATVLAIVVLVVLASGCNLNRLEVGDVQTENETVELGAADSAEVDIRLGAGRLNIDGGAGGLMDATFTYNVDEWEPEVDYEVRGDEGRLRVSQPDTDGDAILDFDDVRYEWDLRFSEEVPLDLAISMGAGEGVLDLSELDLGTFEFRGGAGDVDIDLSSGSVSDLVIRMGAGNVDLDLSGDWRQDLSADIQGGVGSANLKLPAGVGVRVEARGALGEVEARGLSRDGNVYTNDAYGDAEVTLDIQVEGAVGAINLEVVD